MKKWIFGLTLIMIVAGLTAFFYARMNVTDYRFDVKSDAIKAPVEVIFDDMAVPHIYAENEKRCDACIGLCACFGASLADGFVATGRCGGIVGIAGC